MLVTKIILGILSVIFIFLGLLFWNTHTTGVGFIGSSILLLIIIIFMEKIIIIVNVIQNLW